MIKYYVQKTKATLKQILLVGQYKGKIMFKNKIAVALKHGNIILPEFLRVPGLHSENKDKFLLPDNTQYFIYLKNTNDKTALLKVKINGVSVTKESIMLTPKSNIHIYKFEDQDSSFQFNGIDETILSIEIEFIDSNNKSIVPKIMEIELVEDNTIELVKQAKKTCNTCNKKYKYSYSYCPYDGTKLEENNLTQTT